MYHSYFESHALQTITRSILRKCLNTLIRLMIGLFVTIFKGKLKLITHPARHQM